MGGNKTGIAWTDLTVNITEGCMHAGTPACDHCYAEEFAGRFADEGKPFHGLVQIRANGMARWTGVFRERPDRLAGMIGWRNNLPMQYEPDGTPIGPGENGKPRRTRVFVGSMTDTFHEQVSDLFLAAAFAVFGAMGDTHTIQLLTKRPGRARAFFAWLRAQTDNYDPEKLTRVLLDAARVVLGEKAAKKIDHRLIGWRGHTFPPFPFRNVHVGATVENNDAAARRIDDLLACDAWLHWLSMEPLFEDVNLGLMGVVPKTIAPNYTMVYERIRWIVPGLESGLRARPGHVEHLRDALRQAREAGIHPFIKQLGSRPMLDGEPLKLRHQHGARMEEWPEDLRVQEWPED